MCIDVKKPIFAPRKPAMGDCKKVPSSMKKVCMKKWLSYQSAYNFMRKHEGKVNNFFQPVSEQMQTDFAHAAQGLLKQWRAGKPGVKFPNQCKGTKADMDAIKSAIAML